MMLEQYEAMKARIAAEVARHGLTLKPAASAGNLNTLVGMLDAGMGVLLLPRVMARRSLQAGHVMVEIEGIELYRRFCIVMLRDAQPTPVVRRFCRHLREEMAEDARRRILSEAKDPSPVVPSEAKRSRGDLFIPAEVHEPGPSTAPRYARLRSGRRSVALAYRTTELSTDRPVLLIYSHKRFVSRRHFLLRCSQQDELEER